MLSGAKSDAGDAAVIAEYLRLRAPAAGRRPLLRPDPALRTVVRTRDDLVDMRVAATNQLSALLEAHWPGAKAIFADVESPISLAFLTRYPTPAAAAPPRREAHRRVLRQPGLLRQAASRRAARAAALRPGRNTGRGPDRGAARRRPGPGRRAHGAQHRSQGPGPFRRRPPRGASGRRDLHVAAKVGSGQRRPDARRVGRLPPSLRRPRRRRRPGRVHPRHQAVRQAPRRATSAGPATSGSARRSPPSPTTAATPAPGPPRSTTTPAPQAKTTPTPSASSPAPGSA